MQSHNRLLLAVSIIGEVQTGPSATLSGGLADKGEVDKEVNKEVDKEVEVASEEQDVGTTLAAGELTVEKDVVLGNETPDGVQHGDDQNVVLPLGAGDISVENSGIRRTFPFSKTMMFVLTK